uniref:LuxR C-terminal-related transcriptional regulator n=1 Tax=Pararhizobium sp. IMCC3301 TaxID=3067904 RepID=UPI00274240EB|nr:response regulator transcription factor [Pararhizobium sp. IMCC3301]
MTNLQHIIIADDHPLFRGALRQAVEGLFSDAIIHEAGALDEVTAALDAHPDTDLILFDLSMPGARGYSGLMYLRAQYPANPLIVVSGKQDQMTVRHCIDLGASGYIPKSMGIEIMRDAIENVLAGHIWVPTGYDLDAPIDDETANMVSRLSTLTPQQVRVLMMLSEGLLNKQIAYELGVSEATIKAHVSAILQKLNVDSRTQAVIAAARIEAGQWQTPAAPASTDATSNS